MEPFGLGENPSLITVLWEGG